MDKTNNNEVWMDDIHITNLNKKLIEKQNIDDLTLDQIKRMHIIKYWIFKAAKELAPTDIKSIRALAKTYELIEFDLQRLWGFEPDNKFHRFWEFPCCTCPRLDNMDRIGSGMSVYNLSCPVHGNKDQDK